MTRTPAALCAVLRARPSAPHEREAADLIEDLCRRLGMGQLVDNPTPPTMGDAAWPTT